MENNQPNSKQISPVVCWHHGDLQRLRQCLAKNYCDLYRPGARCSAWWRKLGLNVGDMVRFSVKRKVVGSGRIQSDPYDLAAKTGIQPVDSKWPGAVNIENIVWRDGGSCGSPLRLGNHKL